MKSIRFRLIETIVIILIQLIILLIAKSDYINQVKLISGQNNYEESQSKIIKITIENFEEENAKMDKLRKSNKTEKENALQFTVEVLSIVNNNEQSEVYGITSSSNGYSGLIRIIAKSKNNIERYNTYVFTTDTIMKIGDIPEVNCISFVEATEEEKEELELNKENASNFPECMLRYESMDLSDIVATANNEYYRWTDEQILKYQNMIEKLGYTEDYEVKSTVKTIEQLKEIVTNNEIDED
jgi:Na+-translocating ferredoxin:NAD+ oxidoreductase RnfG subunit